MPRSWFASLCFVLSGATALAYEVIWFKRFAHVWGSSSLAMACVVASFLAGLGLGARLLGRWADRTPRPLTAYALCEAGIGLYALALPSAIPWLVGAAAKLHPVLENRPLLHMLVRCAATFALLGPPCMLMGATLPLLVRFFTASGLTLGRSTAWLYAFNALGAAGGAWICGFHLLPSFGLEGANLGAAALNLAIAAAALLYARNLTTLQAGVPANPAASIPSGVPFHDEPCPLPALHVAALLSGLGSLLLQMVWGRELATLLGPTTYAFTAMICVFIAGLGLGSLLFMAFAGERTDLRRWISILVLLLVAATIAGWLASPKLAVLVGALKSQRKDQGFNAALCASVSAALQLLPTLAMGALFPALVQLTRASAGAAGRAVGRVYAWNTLGSIAGALLALPFLLPAIGAAGVIVLALVLYLGVQVLVLLPGALQWRHTELALAVLAGAVLLAPWRERDPRKTNLGLYLYGAELIEGPQGTMSRVLFYEESSGSNVIVLEQDQLVEGGRPTGPPKIRNVRVNGKVDGSNFLDMAMQLGSGYFPLFLRPRSREVLVIGMGTGTTVGATLQFPQTQVTCCEIDPAILEAARLFSEVSHDPHASPRFRAVIDDGRNYMQGTDLRFDLIISEPSNPWIAGVSNLFTLEFYRAALAHLAGGGMLVQWIQTYSLSPEQYALVVRTVKQVFPHCALLRIDEHDTLLVASPASILPPPEQLAESQALVDSVPAIRADLEKYFLIADVRALLLTLWALDEAGLERLLAADGGTTLNTDANLRLEFEAPRDLYARRSPDRQSAADRILASMQPAAIHRAILHWGWTSPQLTALKALRSLLASKGFAREAAEIVEIALVWEPDDPELIADQLLYAPPGDDESFRQTVVHLLSKSPEQAWRVGKSLAQRGNPARARIVLEALSEKMPSSATIWASLAVVYANLAREDDARAAIEKARALDPLDELPRDMERVLGQDKRE